MASSISDEHLSTLRAIAKAGFTYDTTKELAATNHWQLTEDESDLGYLRFNVELLTGEPPLSAVVEFGNEERPPFAFVPLFCFPEMNEQLSGFNNAFQFASWELDRLLGAPLMSGEYGFSHQDWQYLYRWWSTPEAELVLVQDEFDILDGYDVTLWILPAGTPKNLPVRP